MHGTCPVEASVVYCTGAKLEYSQAIDLFYGRVLCPSTKIRESKQLIDAERNNVLYLHDIKTITKFLGQVCEPYIELVNPCSDHGKFHS